MFFLEKLKMLPNKQSETYLPLAILAVFGFIIALARTHTYYEPLEWDLTLVCGYCPRHCLEGGELYSDLGS